MAILGAGFVFCLAVNWPGHLSYDSVIQLLEGRRGQYSNWHPAVMSWLLGLGDSVLPGAALFILFDMAVLFGAMVCLVWSARRVSWLAAPVTLAILALPQIVLYQGIVWKDVLFADACVGGFVCLALMAKAWEHARQRTVLLTGAMTFLVLASLARQNGFIMLLSGVLGAGTIAARKRPGSGMRFGIAMLCAALAVFALAWLALNSRNIPGGGTTEQWAQLQAFDIAGAVAADPALPLAVWHKHAPTLARAMRAAAATDYSPQRNDTLALVQPLQQALSDTAPDLIAAQWRALIIYHPWLYLRVRSDIFTWTFLTPQIGACVPFVAGVHGAPQILVALRMKPRWDRRDAWLDRYATLFTATPAFAHGAFALLAVVLLAVFLWRRRDADIAMAAMLGGALIFVLSFFVISLACDYRYLYALDLSVLMGVFYLVLDAHLPDNGADEKSSKVSN